MEYKYPLSLPVPHDLIYVPGSHNHSPFSISAKIQGPREAATSNKRSSLS